MIELQRAQQKLADNAQFQGLLPHLQETLFAPLDDFFARPRKDFRGKMIEIGYDLARAALQRTSSPNQDKAQSEAQNSHNVRVLKDLLESLHSGSLIVDDIQDNSLVRRGDSTLHLKYGVPTALNAGNWLYFLAFKLIEDLKVPAAAKLRFYSAITETLYGAHLGQALDVGTPIDELSSAEQILLCQRSLELKSGLLMGLALELGALLTEVSDKDLRIIREFGVEFGVALQRFDDLGNLNIEKPTPKHLEDLSLRRPSWVWCFLASDATAKEKEEFQAALESLPDIKTLKSFLESTDFKQRCFLEASRRLQVVINNLGTHLQLEPTEEIFVKVQKLGEQLTHAYK